MNLQVQVPALTYTFGHSFEFGFSRICGSGDGEVSAILSKPIQHLLSKEPNCSFLMFSYVFLIRFLNILLRSQHADFEALLLHVQQAASPRQQVQHLFEDCSRTAIAGSHDGHMHLSISFSCFLPLNHSPLLMLFARSL